MTFDHMEFVCRAYRLQLEGNGYVLLRPRVGNYLVFKRYGSGVT